MTDQSLKVSARRKSRGDHIALALLFSFFAFSAFALNPEGWGVFDWMAVTTFALLAIWSLVRAFL